MSTDVRMCADESSCIADYYLILKLLSILSLKALPICAYTLTYITTILTMKVRRNTSAISFVVLLVYSPISSVMGMKILLRLFQTL